MRFLLAIIVAFGLGGAGQAQVPTPEQIQALQQELALDLPQPVEPPPALTLPESDPPVPSLTPEPRALSASQRYFRALLGEVLEPFGLLEFATPGRNELLLFNTLAESYRLSAGDHLQIVIRGLEPANLEVVVDRSGAVTLPRLMPVIVSGLTAAEVARHLEETIQVNDASARVAVVVTAARLVPVQAGGMVREPQLLALPAFTPLSLAIARAGGLHPDASLRSVRVLSQDGAARTVDLYGLLLGETGFSEPILAEGDRLFVPTAGPTIAITGLVPRQGIFELAPGQEGMTVAEALALSGLSLVPKGIPVERMYFAHDGLPTSAAVEDPDTTWLGVGEALRVGLVEAAPQGDITVVGALIEPFTQPHVPGLRLSALLKGGAVFDASADGDVLVVIPPPQSQDQRVRLLAIQEIIGGGQNPELVPGTKVFVPSRAQVNDVLRVLSGEETGELDLLERSVVDDILVTSPARIHIDGRLVAIVPTGVDAGLIDRFRIALARTNIYPGYALLEEPDGRVRARSFVLPDQPGPIGLSLDRGVRLHLFSKDVIGAFARSLSGVETVLLGDEDIGTGFVGSDKLARRLVSDTRLVFGEVGEPGGYPVAGRASLADLLAAAGGIMPSGDLASVIVREFRIEGSTLNLARERVLDLSRLDPHSVMLDGLYNIRVPPVINDGFVGSVTLAGEVKRPGTYTIARGETIGDILARAGGLTRTAYPLGAVLSRRSLVEAERVANGQLADQLRQGVIVLSQADREGAADQIEAVLGFAQDLEAAPATGRQVVNLVDSSAAALVLMEDGDRLVVPPRPSNVRIIGAVYSEVATQYREGARPGDYIEDAGGLTRLADPRRAFMVLPNGQSLPLDLRRKREEVPVPPGSVIVVPPKIDRVTPLQLTETMSRALGNIASSILAIDVLTGQ